MRDPRAKTMVSYAVVQSGEDSRDSLDGSKRPTIRDAPGAGLVMWAESAVGAVELERPYTRSATLDGASSPSVGCAGHMVDCV